MKTKTLVVFIATLLLGLVGTPALLASSGSTNSEYRRGGHGYDAGYRVKQLARELENASERVLYELKRDRYGRSRHAIEAVYNLHECAEVYERKVRRYSSLRHSYDDLRGLAELYQEADYTLSRSRNRSAQHELYRVGRLIEALNAEYARAYRNTGRNRDHNNGRYDNDRYGNNRNDTGRYDRRDTGRSSSDWRYRERGGATIVLPRIRLRLPF